jgi:hypothetical protein
MVSKLAQVLMDEGVITQMDPRSRAGSLFTCLDCSVSYLKEKALENHFLFKDHPRLVCFKCTKQSIYLVACPVCHSKCCTSCSKTTKVCFKCNESLKRKAKEIEIMNIESTE